MYLQEVKGAEAMGEREREEEAVSPPVIPFDQYDLSAKTSKKQRY
jgi:hypothetical protein